MGIYKNFQYGDGTLYGSSVKIGYSSAPLTLSAIGKTTILKEVVVGKSSIGELIFAQKEFSVPQVEVTWNKPSGDIFGFRITRNQSGFSEHEEDGEIIVSTFDPVVPEETYFLDGVGASPLVEGRYAFYTVWLRTVDNAWVVGAQNYLIIPKEHNVLRPEGDILKTSARKFVELFPKVFSTAGKSYLDEIDETSDFFNFMRGFAYTYDEILTYVDLLVPDASGNGTNPNMVDLEVAQFGLPGNAAISAQRKKALIRNNGAITQNKGTTRGVDALVTSLTGFTTQVAVSNNLLLSAQDSTFYKGVGRWVAGTNGTLTSNLTTGAGDLPPTNETYSIDTQYTGKLITTGSNVSITLGATSPLLNAVPVTAGVEYSFSYYVKGTAVNVTPSIKWYDRKGELIGSEVTGTAAAATSTFTKKTQTATSPDEAVVAVLALKFASAGTFYVDLIQFANSTITDYHEARAVEIKVEPTKVNFITNPSLKSGTGWTITGGSSVSYVTGTVPGIDRDESSMLSVTTTSGTPFSLSTYTPEILSDDGYYTFSIYAKTATANAVENLTFKIEVWEDNDIAENGDVGFYPLLKYTSAGAPLIASNTPADGVGDAWQRYSVTLFVPGAYGAVLLRGVVEGDGEGNALYFDAAQIERGSKALDYFDGSYVISGGQWDGTADASVSFLYRNRFEKLPRLAGALKDYLPLNTPWILTSGYGNNSVVEASGFSS